MTAAATPEHLTTQQVRDLPETLERFREMLLANLIMVGEIPAPTFDESDRIEFVEQRFTECALENVSRDAIGNGLGILPGRDGRRSILVTAHADTPFSYNIPHTVNVDMGCVYGPAVADNSLGLATLVTLPTIIQELGLEFDHNLVFMAATRSLGRGNLEGLRSFLAGTKLPISAGISVEGVELGRMDYMSLSTLGGEITCTLEAGGRDKEYDRAGAIAVLNQLITRLRTIPLPGQAATRLVLGAVEGGTSYKSPAKSALLRFQLRSESDSVTDGITEQILDICEEIHKASGLLVTLDIISRTHACGLTEDHPLVARARHIMHTLGIEPLAPVHSSSASAFMEHGVPSLTIGISYGENRGGSDEYVEIEPMLRGTSQLIGILMDIDGGCCDGH